MESFTTKARGFAAYIGDFVVKNRISSHQAVSKGGFFVSKTKQKCETFINYIIHIFLSNR